MNIILKERLEKCAISVEDIIAKLILKKEDSVYIYTSHLEGLGTDDSDMDVYVICNELPNNNSFIKCDDCNIQNIVVKSTLLDIEYWSIIRIKLILDKLSNKKNKLTLNEMKLIQKLIYSELIYSGKHKLNFKDDINVNNLKTFVLENYVLKANSYLEDSIYMYNAQEYFCSLNCAFYALENAIGAFNTVNNVINVKEKWISKIFIKNKAYNNKNIYEKYLKYQIYTNITSNNIIDFVENKIDFIKEILVNIII